MSSCGVNDAAMPRFDGAPECVVDSAAPAPPRSHTTAPTDGVAATPTPASATRSVHKPSTDRAAGTVTTNAAAHAAALETELRHRAAKLEAGGAPSARMLLRSLARVARRPLALACGLMLIESMCTLAAPIIIRALLQWTEEAAPQLGRGVGLVIALAIVSVLTFAASHQFEVLTQRIGLQSRAAAVGMMYRKLLRCNAVEVAQTSSGELLSLFSTDSMDVVALWHGVISLLLQPLEMLGVVALLFAYVDLAAFGAVAVILLVVLGSHACSFVVERKQSQRASIADVRTRDVYEMLLGMKVVKLNAWEPRFVSAIRQHRAHEVRLSRSATWYLAIVNVAGGNSIEIMSFTVVLLYTLAMGRTLTSSMVFTFWVLLSLLHARLFHFPIALKHTQDGFAALARMQEYLLRAEQAAVALPPTPALPAVPDKSALDAAARVRATGCSFSWRAASTHADADTTAHDRATSLLQGVSLELRDGELGCVVGPVGSGKSTLLLGLLRETRLTAGTLHVSARSIAYVSQTAWIYAATVRDNIVMGRAYEREWYNAVTAACALDHDLALLADGDATSVSNCTLSGGQRQRISLARAVYANADLYLLDDCLSALDTRVIRHIVDECLRKLLRCKAVLLITSSPVVLQHCTWVCMTRALHATTPAAAVAKNATVAAAADVAVVAGAGGVALPPASPTAAAVEYSFTIDSGSFEQMLERHAALQEIMSSTSEEAEGATVASPPAAMSALASSRSRAGSSAGVHAARARRSSSVTAHAATRGGMVHAPALHAGAVSDALTAGHALGMWLHDVAAFPNEGGLALPPSSTLRTQGALDASSPCASPSNVVLDSEPAAYAQPSEMDAHAKQAAASHLHAGDGENTGSTTPTAVGWSLLHSLGGVYPLLGALLCSAVEATGVEVGLWWLSRWCDDPALSAYPLAVYLAVYAALVAGEQMGAYVRQHVLSRATIRSNDALHDALLHRIVTAPMSFFDAHSVSSIMQWIGRDMTNLEQETWYATEYFFVALFYTIYMVIIQAVASVWTLLSCAFSVLVVAVVFALRRAHRKRAAATAPAAPPLSSSKCTTSPASAVPAAAAAAPRMEDVSAPAARDQTVDMLMAREERVKAPLLEHISTTLEGLVTLRSHAKAEEWTHAMFPLLDVHTRALDSVCASEARTVLWTNMVGVLYYISSVVIVVALRATSLELMTPGNAGLVVVSGCFGSYLINLLVSNYTVLKSLAFTRARLVRTVCELPSELNHACTREAEDAAGVASSVDARANARLRAALAAYPRFSARMNPAAAQAAKDEAASGAHTPLPVVVQPQCATLRDAPAEWPSAGHVRLVGVQLRYTPTGPLVLRDVSFDIKAGQHVAIVGRTGAGKSSIIAALTRIVEPHAGSIEIDGLNTRHIPLSQLRTRVGVISQDPLFFSGSLRRNLDPFAQYTDEQLVDALHRVQLYDFAVAQQRLQRGEAGVDVRSPLDIAIAERGANLSLGEQQLLAAARSYLRHPRVLLMDEATASLDVASEERLQATVRDMFASSTVIQIAHRLRSIIHCDEVLVMQDGMLAERGSPRELLSRPHSIFSSMVAALAPQQRAALLAKAGLSLCEPSESDAMVVDTPCA